MRVGLSSAAFYGRMETEEEAAHTAALGVSCCEVFLETFSEYSGDFGRKVRARLGETPCVSVHPKGTQFESDLFGRSYRQVEDAMAWFAGVCDAGKALGAKYYIFHGPPGLHGPMAPGKIHALAPTMARLRDIAGARRMEVLWENVYWCALRTPEQVAEAIALVPETRFTLDIKQAYRAGVTPEVMLDAMGGRLRHVHALDRRADGSLCLPGEGDVDWPGIICRLKAMGYDGDIILEPYESQARDEAALVRSLRYLDSLLHL